MVDSGLRHLLGLSNCVVAHHGVASVGALLVNCLTRTCVARRRIRLFRFILVGVARNKTLLSRIHFEVQFVFHFDFLSLVFEHVLQQRRV